MVSVLIKFQLYSFNLRMAKVSQGPTSQPLFCFLFIQMLSQNMNILLTTVRDKRYLENGSNALWIERLCFGHVEALFGMCLCNCGVVEDQGVKSIIYNACNQQAYTQLVHTTHTRTCCRFLKSILQQVPS